MKNIYDINRALGPGQYHLADVFRDIHTYGIIADIFCSPEEVARVLTVTKVHIVDRAHEMFVDNDDASITIGLTHLRQAPDEVLYLDIIHELCHVKQQMEGRNLYDRSRCYVDRETEIEAYEVTVREARRIGLDDQAIVNYLHVSWITAEEHKRLVCRLDVGK